MNHNFFKLKGILEITCNAREKYFRQECLEISGVQDSISNNNLQETVLKMFSETGVIIDSRDVEAYHRLNQPANPKTVVIKLSKGKDVAMVLDNNKKLKVWDLKILVYNLVVKLT